MKYFTETGNDEAEALEKIYSKYGRSVKILQKREIKIGGILGMFSKTGVELSGYIQPVSESVTIEQEKKKILENAKKKEDDTNNIIISELLSLKKELKDIKDTSVSLKQQPEKDESETNPNLIKLRKVLQKNEFEEYFIQDVISFIKREFTLEDINDYEKVQYFALNYIGDSIAIWKREADVKRPVIFIIIGPTGVGKTTTLAKLSANIRISAQVENKDYNVKIMTLDNFRIGAKEQIEIYGNIMDVPVLFIENEEEYSTKLNSIIKGTDYIFVDSIGRSPFDWSSIEYIKKISDISTRYGTVETHLTINSSTKTSDIENIIKQFELFNYKSIILSKLDETINIGNIISVLVNYKKPVSYLTIGQKVPTDIIQANKNYFLSRLTGFDIDLKDLEDGNTE